MTVWNKQREKENKKQVDRNIASLVAPIWEGFRTKESLLFPKEFFLRKKVEKSFIYFCFNTADPTTDFLSYLVRKTDFLSRSFVIHKHKNRACLCTVRRSSLTGYATNTKLQNKKWFKERRLNNRIHWKNLFECWQKMSFFFSWSQLF